MMRNSSLPPSPITRHSSPSPPATLPPSVTVEFFGVPRLLMRARSLTANGATLADLAADLVRRSPALAGRVLDAGTGWPLDGYSFVVDEQFTRDRDLQLRPGTSVLLVASAAGG
jgi:molybdopterin converting factor small subunit